MSDIVVNVNTKGKAACSANIDINIGCSNNCIGCYGRYVSYQGEKFYTATPVEKNYDYEKLKKSILSFKRKNISIARCNKFCDITTSNIGGTLNEVIKTATEQEFRLVLVSKSIPYDREIAKLLKSGNHVLHISLGMISDAPSEYDRLNVAVRYLTSNVNTKLRLVYDITKDLPVLLQNNIGLNFLSEQCIVTPMRYRSKNDAEKYDADLTKYKYSSGYYRLLTEKIHKDWVQFNNWCGESVNSDGTTNLMCCKCLTE